MTKDIIDRLTEYEAPLPTQGKDGKRFGMAVPRRASCPEEIEDIEADYLAQPIFPVPFWDENNNLEPLTHDDFKLLAAAGITPEEWEIAVLEDHLEKRNNT